MDSSQNKLLRTLYIIISSVKNVGGKLRNLWHPAEDTADMFHALSPYDKADEDGTYSEALSWALENRDKYNIRNIALTGTYGSGKSSILVTFQKSYKEMDLHFLNISLATFKDETEKDSFGLLSKQNNQPIAQKDKEGDYQENRLRLIELSILQQIFYHENDITLPDSRLKRIKSYPAKNIIRDAIVSLVVIVAIVYKFFPSCFFKFVNFCLPPSVLNFLFWISSAIIVIAAFLLLKKILRSLKNLRLSKLNINNSVDIEIDDDISKSILNHHFDEILYFFEVTKYNVVIIEDLDRFKQTEVFTKLREINLLINNSKKIKRSIVFIYAIRDDMFADNERTKFFDFIIPVIPVINSSNSSEILRKEINKIFNDDFKLDAMSELIDDISHFVSDMRLLYNILNEYIIYRKKLNMNLNPSKLLAIIFYKNLFPNDFVALCNGGGEIVAMFNKKQTQIINKTNKLDEQINTIRKAINDADREKRSDIKELISLYVFQYIAEIKNGISAFYINNKKYSFEEVLNEEYFSYLVNKQFQYYQIQTTLNYNQSTREVLTSHSIPDFKTIEEKVCKEYTFAQRKNNLETKTIEKNTELKQKINQLEEEKKRVRISELKDIYQSDMIDPELFRQSQGKIIDMLIRNGYIDESYNDYVSLFHEGSLTRSDNDFWVNIKNRVNPNFDYKLIKIDNLIKKISKNDFETGYILNYNLMDTLLSNENYTEQIELIFKFLSSGEDSALKFIDGFIQNGVHISSFIDKLCCSWSGFWTWINNNTDFDNSRKNLYMKLILESSKIENIKNICTSDFLNKISATENPEAVCANLSMLKNIIGEFSIKFEKLDYSNMSKDLFEYIYQGNYYKITIDTLLIILKHYERFNQVDFDTRNYFALQESQCNLLIGNIDANTVEYLNDVYLRLENNTAEPQESLLLLLNRSDITLDMKKKIIKKVSTILTDLMSVTELDVRRIILQESKVTPSWLTILLNFHDEQDTISDVLLSYLNNSVNAHSLSKTQIKKELLNGIEIEENVFWGFLRSILLEEKIFNDNYSILLKGIPFFYDANQLQFSSLSEGKVSLLIENQKLKLSNENFKVLKDTFKHLHIKLLEKYDGVLLNKLSLFTFDMSDIYQILISEHLSMTNKNAIIKTIAESDIIADIKILDAIGNCILASETFEASDVVVKSIILKTTMAVATKLAILLAGIIQLDNSIIGDCLIPLGEPYSTITMNGKRPLLEKSDINLRLARNLKEKGYISGFAEESKGIRINTFKGQDQ